VFTCVSLPVQSALWSEVATIEPLVHAYSHLAPLVGVA
jgi:hypothetical protein